MFAIDSAGSNNGQFTEGNPAAGVRPTKVSADWLNAVQGEILSVLAQAGIQPDKANSGQLLAAAMMLFANRHGDTFGGPIAVTPGASIGVNCAPAFGGVALAAGDASHTGFLALHGPDGTRRGYLGFIGPGGSDAYIAYFNEHGSGHVFRGGRVAIESDLSLTAAACHLYQSNGWGFFDDTAGRTSVYYRRDDNSLNVDAATLRHVGNTVWTSGNDGSGSGLDADTVRGYVPASRAGDTFTGSIAVTPGSYVQVNWDAGHGGSALMPSDAAHSGYVAYLASDGQRRGYAGFVGADNVVNYSNDKGGGHRFAGGGLTADGNIVWTSGNDGSGSGLDADTVRGYVPANRAGDVFQGNLAVVPGSSIGLNCSAAAGGTALAAGDASHTGFVALHGPDGVRRGYLGYVGADGAVVYRSEAGGGHNFSGGQLSSDGARVWSASNDGAGSGLDADTWRGRAPADFDFGNPGSHSFGTTGWEKLPNGKIRQWGSTVVPSGSNGLSHVDFPIAFPNQCMSAGATNDSGSGQAVAWAGVGAIGPTGMTVSHNTASGQPAAAGTAAFWWAEGF